MSPAHYLSTLSLHDALPIYPTTQPPIGCVAPTWVGPTPRGLPRRKVGHRNGSQAPGYAACLAWRGQPPPRALGDRKSTRLNSSHVAISYAVFCLTKTTKQNF